VKRLSGCTVLFSLIFFGVGLDAKASEAGAHSYTSYAFVGSVFRYTIQPGDKLDRVGARFGVSSAVLARGNQLERNSALLAGDTLWVENLHIVPEWRYDGIVINLPQRMLFYFRQGTLAAAFPVGLGMPDWPTPIGNFKVTDLQTNKAWVVPPAIQEEMRREGKAVLTRVPPGPKNPLGRHWIGLNAAGYGIHGTSAPASIYGFPSHGCIRAHPDDIAVLAQWAEVGMDVVSSYRTTLLAETLDGRVFLEVHRDIYQRGIDALEETRKLVQNYRLEGCIDWQRALDVAQRKDGLARDVTLIY
jgi:L,D-transpeptidase ErfK/SrfK